MNDTPSGDHRRRQHDYHRHEYQRPSNETSPLLRDAAAAIPPPAIISQQQRIHNNRRAFDAAALDLSEAACSFGESGSSFTDSYESDYEDDSSTDDSDASILVYNAIQPASPSHHHSHNRTISFKSNVSEYSSIGTLGAPSIAFPDYDDESNDEESNELLMLQLRSHRRYSSYHHGPCDRFRQPSSWLVIMLAVAVIVFSAREDDLEAQQKEYRDRQNRERQRHHDHSSHTHPRDDDEDHVWPRNSISPGNGGNHRSPPPTPQNVLWSKSSKQDATEEISFSDLAAVMLPPWFASTIKLADIVLAEGGYEDGGGGDDSGDSDDGTSSRLLETSDEDTPSLRSIHATSSSALLPRERVDVLRKTILQTRDLLDVFAPVYSGRVQHLHKVEDMHSRRDEYSLEMKLAPKDVRVAYDSLMERVKEEQGLDVTDVTDDASTNDDAATSTLLEFQSIELHEKDDVWCVLRLILRDGYVVLGEIEDLNHWHIKYTPDQLLTNQEKVWEWKARFLDFVQQYDALGYLSHPCPPHHSSSGGGNETISLMCQHHHPNISNATINIDMQDGFHPAASAIRTRAASQLQRAALHVNLLQNVTDVLEDEGVHHTYHALWKELRIFLDELDLFGNLLLPDFTSTEAVDDSMVVVDTKTGDEEKKQPQPQGLLRTTTDNKKEEQISGAKNNEKKCNNAKTNHIIDALKHTRKMLRDLDSDHMAYATYVRLDEYPEERQRLKHALEDRWGDFRGWELEVDLLGSLECLIGRIDGH